MADRVLWFLFLTYDQCDQGLRFILWGTTTTHLVYIMPQYCTIVSCYWFFFDIFLWRRILVGKSFVFYSQTLSVYWTFEMSIYLYKFFSKLGSINQKIKINYFHLFYYTNRIFSKATHAGNKLARTGSITLRIPMVECIQELEIYIITHNIITCSSTRVICLYGSKRDIYTDHKRRKSWMGLNSFFVVCNGQVTIPAVFTKLLWNNKSTRNLYMLYKIRYFFILIELCSIYMVPVQTNRLSNVFIVYK